MKNNNKNNLTRKELADAINGKLGYSQTACAELVDAFLESMKTTLLQGESIKLVNYGTLTIKDKNPRKGRNPRTGEEIIIKERQMVSFTPGKKLKKRVNNEL